MTRTQNNTDSGSGPSPGKKSSPWLVWTLRLVLSALAGVVLLIGLLMVVIEFGPVQNRLRSTVEKALSGGLGAVVTIEKIEGNLLSGISLRGISVKCPDNRSFLSIRMLSADYFLPMAFFKIIRIRNVTINGLQLDLRKTPSGQWQLPPFSEAPRDAAPETKGATPFRLHIANVLITDTRVNLSGSHQDTGVPALVDITRFSAALDIDDTITLAVTDSDLTLDRPTAIPLSLSGQVFFQPGAVAGGVENFRIRSGASLVVLDGDGRLSESMPHFSVAMEFRSLDLAEISELFSLPGLPQSPATGRLEASGTPRDLRHALSLKVGDAALNVTGTTGFDDVRGLWSDLSVSVADFDPAREKLSFSDVLGGVISADISLNGDHLLSPARSNAVAAMELNGLSVSGLPLETLRADADWSGVTLSIRHLEALTGQNRISLSGTLTPDAKDCQLVLVGELPSPSSLVSPLFARLPEPPAAFDGGIRIDAALTGWLDRPSLMFSVNTDGVTVKQYHAQTIRASGTWEGLPGPDGRMDQIDVSIQGLDGEHLDADSLSLTGNWFGWTGAPTSRFSIISSNVTLWGEHADRLDVEGFWQGRPGPDHRLDDVAVQISGLGGDIAEAKALSLTGAWHGWIGAPFADIDLQAEGLSWRDLRADDLNLSAALKGSPTAPDARFHVSLDAAGVLFDRFETRTLRLSADGSGPFSGFSGTADLDAKEASLYGQLFTDLSLSGHIMSDNTVFSVFGNHDNGSRFEVGGNIASWKTAPRDVTIDVLSLVTTAPWPSSTLSNSSPLRFTLGEDRLVIASCQLQLNDAAFSLSGEMGSEGALGVDLSIGGLELASLPGAWNDTALLSGTAALTAAIRGDLTRPVITSRLEIDNLSGYGISQTTDLSATVDYADTSVRVGSDLIKEDARILSAAGNLPFRLCLKPFSFSSVPEAMTAAVKTRDLRFSELPIPPVEGIEWDAVADMDLQVSGTPDAPDISGSFAIRDGRITLVKNNLTYESFTAGISMSKDRIVIDRMQLKGDREGLLTVGGTVYITRNMPVIADLTLKGENFYIPFQKAISARISPDLHLSGSIEKPRLSGEVTISESRINLDQLSRAPRSDIQVVEGTDADPEATMMVASRSPGFLSPLSADISVRVPRNAWLRGQDVTAEISGDIAIRKNPGDTFVLLGPLTLIRGNYYFMGKNFQLTGGNVEFLGLRDMNPNLNIETETRIKSVTIIATLHGTAKDLMVDLSSDPSMDDSDIISYLVFGRGASDLSGNQAFSVENSALGLTGGLLAAELRTLLGDASLVDTFSFDAGSDDRSFGAITLGKYITPDIFISHRQGLSESEPSYQEITYELTPQIKLETQIGRDQNSSADLTWEFDF